MLNIIAVDIKGEILNLGVPLSLTLKTEEDVPADSVELTLSGTGFPLLKQIEILRDESLIFEAEVDEQIESFGVKPVTRLVARSYASLLIDSEAYPMSFLNPSAQDIFNRYAKPFGFELRGENKELNGRFTVGKGVSCFSVIKKFSEKVYGAFPRCEGKVLYINGKENTDKLCLGSEGIPLESLKTYNLRYSRVSRVYLKLKEGEGYKSFIADNDAENEGINKIRYLNASSTSSFSVEDADRILSQAKAKSFYAEAVCRGYLGDALGKTAKVESIEEELYVSALKYYFGNDGEYTKLTLKRKEK